MSTCYKLKNWDIRRVLKNVASRPKCSECESYPDPMLVGNGSVMLDPFEMECIALARQKLPKVPIWVGHGHKTFESFFWASRNAEPDETRILVTEKKYRGNHGYFVIVLNGKDFFLLPPSGDCLVPIDHRKAIDFADAYECPVEWRDPNNAPINV